jgi:uncharacterized protein
MRLDLRDIINIPGAGVSFDYEPDLSEAVSGSVRGVRNTRASGGVANRAGVLRFTADVDAVLECTCARCLRDFEKRVRMSVETTLSDREQDSGDPDEFPMEGDAVDADAIILTSFILNLDERVLCREDCKGLCQRCGADLNEGPCACKKEIDPRLAALRRLIED